MNIKAILAGAVAGMMLAGCASTYSAKSGYYEHNEGFGEANRQTYAAMIVNPDPVYTEPLETSAQSAADAVDRVRERQVIQPEAEDTTSLPGGGGGGG